MTIPKRKLQSQASSMPSKFIGRFMYGLYLIECRHESMLFFVLSPIPYLIFINLPFLQLRGSNGAFGVLD